MRVRSAVLVGVAALVVAGCGEGTAGTASAPVPTPVTAPTPAPTLRPTDQATTDTALTITLRTAPRAEPQNWTLGCSPPSGSHPDPARACAALAAADRPFAPVPMNVLCTQVYGGPETAKVTGTYRGERVVASYKRTDGCEIARWEKLAALLAPR